MRRLCGVAILAAVACQGTTGPATDGGTEDPVPDGPQSLGAAVLVLGPASRDVESVAELLQSLADSDTDEAGTEVDALVLPAPVSEWLSEMSLMTAWYQQTDRDARLATMTGDWDHVVLIDAPNVAGPLPEFHFEGVRALSNHFEAQGARVHLLLEPADGDTLPADVVEHSYRVAQGTSTTLIPAGLAEERLTAPSWAAMAALTTYASVRGVSPSEADPFEGMGETRFATLSDAVFALVEGEREVEHVSGPFAGAVRVQDRDLPASYGVMIAGTSSERGYLRQMEAFLTERSIAVHTANLGQCTDVRSVDEACLKTAGQQFEARDFVSLYARDYDVTQGDVVAAGGDEVQSQLYDRHWDATENDGLGALDDIEVRMRGKLEQARLADLAFVPHHVFWGRLKDADPDAQLLSDGVHATESILYGLAAMSFVAATGHSTQAKGLDPARASVAALAEQCVREWATLQEH